ncbi:hypothetical protein ACLOJK_041763 [Asimina triloba]
MCTDYSTPQEHRIRCSIIFPNNLPRRPTFGDFRSANPIHPKARNGDRIRRNPDKKQETTVMLDLKPTRWQAPISQKIGHKARISDQQIERAATSN